MKCRPVYDILEPDMTAGIYNFTIEQGTTFRTKFRWTDPDGNPIILSNASCRLQIRKSQLTTSKLLADLTQYMTLDAMDGSVSVLVPGNITSGYTFDTGRFSLRVDRPGDDRRLVQGLVRISRETTV